MSSLPKKLKNTEGIGHALYADSLAIWTTVGSAGQQEALQGAIHITEEYLECYGLSHAPGKSELLVVRERTRPPQEIPEPKITIGGVEVSEVNVLRICLVQKDGAGGAELQKIQKAVT